MISRLGTLPISPSDWPRDGLPEHLWIASLISADGDPRSYQLFEGFLDAIDTVCPEGTVSHGLISDFALVPASRRDEFKSTHGELIYEAFHKPFGRLLAFYPAGPASWLVQQDRIEREGPLDPDVELSRLRELVTELLPGNDLRAGDIRTMPFTRVVKHAELQFPRNLKIGDSDVVDLLCRYPHGCNEEEKYAVQQFCRTSMNALNELSDRYADRAWPKYFWRHNWDLVPCNQRQRAVSTGNGIEIGELEGIVGLLERNSAVVIDYVKLSARQLHVDLYDSERDEILAGLFARITRLYVLIARHPQLWARDLTGILLRCLTDTAITFTYLANRGTEEQFAAFRRYGEGKEKLLMLHLQDNYPELASVDGRTAAEIAQGLGGGITPELIDIELDNWTKRSARDLAIDAGMERFYRLVYDPASSDIHGTWVSLKHSNLARCAEPLHRFHRLPAYTEPPLFLGTVHAAQAIYLHCLSVAVDRLRFPQPVAKLEPLPYSPSI